jgi:hypothetical protein
MDIIRRANITDKNRIMNFIHTEWKENHILSRDDAFFLYEHGNDNYLNFIISINVENKINGILGFIPSSFSNDIDACTVIWKVSNNNINPVLGIQLLQYLKDTLGFRTLMSVGINKKTIGIYNYLGFHTDYLRHYVLLNPSFGKFKIAKVDCELSKPNFEKSNFNLVLINENSTFESFDFDFFKKFIPFKDYKYFSKRYLNHPIYKYEIYGIYKQNILSSLIVTRRVETNDSKVLRIVDYIGDFSDFSKIGEQLFNVLIKYNFEYIDFLNFGFEPEYLLKSGFFEISDQNSKMIIIPNYFSPFIQENVVIHFFADTDDVDLLRICKGHGDQDRPNN